MSRGSDGHYTNRCNSQSELLRDLVLLLVKERVLAENDVQPVDIFELAQEVAKWSLQVMGHRRMNGE